MNTAPTQPKTAAPVELDFEARLAEVGAIMEGRIALAHLAFGVDSAHIPSAEPIPEVVAPMPLIPTVAPCPYTTPIATTLHQARVRLETDGWCTGQLRDTDGAACLIGVIRAAAGSRSEADDACVLLLEAIRRDFNVETIPAWNDVQRDPRLPSLYLDRAATLAHARGL